MLDLNNKNGATCGTGLEKYCVEFAQMCLQETELVEQVYKFLRV